GLEAIGQPGPADRLDEDGQAVAAVIVLNLVDVVDLAIAFQRVAEVETVVEASGRQVVTITDPDAAAPCLTDPAIDAQEGIGHLRILQFQPGGDQHLRQVEEAEPQAGIETDAVALAIAYVA